MKVEKRFVNLDELANQRRGSTQLGPGVWVDRGGAMHFSVPDLLEYFGEPNTPENRERMTAMIRQTFEAQAPAATLIEQEERRH